MDHKRNVRNVVAGWSGSVNNARVYNKSALKTLFDSGAWPPPEKKMMIQGLAIPIYVLGDPIFPESKNMLKVFPGTFQELSPEQVVLNKKHSSARHVVKHKYGMLKRPFALMDSHKFEIQGEHTATDFIVTVTSASRHCHVTVTSPGSTLYSSQDESIC